MFIIHVIPRGSLFNWQSSPSAVSRQPHPQPHSRPVILLRGDVNADRVRSAGGGGWPEIPLGGGAQPPVTELSSWRSVVLLSWNSAADLRFAIFSTVLFRLAIAQFLVTITSEDLQTDDFPKSLSFQNPIKTYRHRQHWEPSPNTTVTVNFSEVCWPVASCKIFGNNILNNI